MYDSSSLFEVILSQVAELAITKKMEIKSIILFNGFDLYRCSCTIYILGR